MKPTPVDLGILLVSAALLLLELLLTRIFSVTLFYHLSFMVVSLAMLGFGASGLIVTLWPDRFSAPRLPTKLAVFALGFSLTSVLAVAAAFRLTMPLQLSGSDWTKLALLYVFCLLPFLCGGFVVSLILTHHSAHANRLYSFDLLGAALGCVAFIPLTNALGAPSAVLAAAAVGAVGAVVLAGAGGRTPRLAALAIAVTLLAAAAANRRWGFYDVHQVKGVEPPPLLAVRWNSFSRVEVMGTTDTMWQRLPVVDIGTSPTLDPDYRAAQVLLRYDSDAATEITQFDGDARKLLHLGVDVASAAHHVQRFDEVLVIGPGGGRDILTALHLGSRAVTGVEINPLTVQLMKTRFRTFSGGLYDGFPGVRVIVDEARSFLRSSNARYDLIQATLVDTWAASAAGAYSLTENNLYTVEAFEDYLRHLRPDGVVSFSRWFAEPPVEVARVVLLAAEAMRELGTTKPSAHVFVLQTVPRDAKQPSLGTILVKRSPFTGDELARLRAWTDEMRFRVRYSPDDEPRGVETNELHQLFQAVEERTGASLPFGLTPVRDDRPFFFSGSNLIAWLGARLGLTKGRPGLDLGGRTLLVSLLGSIIATALLLSLPLVRMRGARAPDGGRRRSIAWACYFGCLGLGFIMVEIVLIQWFGLYLGYPVYALTVVLFTLLLTSGIGSLLARRQPMRSLPKLLLALTGALVAFLVLVPIVVRHTLGSPTPVRIAIAAACIAPLGLLMGAPFATGLRAAGAEDSWLVPWAWAVNGGASVLGSTMTIVVSITFGFSTSLTLGAAAYAIALGIVQLVLREERAGQSLAAPATIVARSPEPGPSSVPLRGWPAIVVLAAIPLLAPMRRPDEGDLLPPLNAVGKDESIHWGAGWYDLERAGDLSWRWAAARAEVRVENTRADMKLHVRGYLPVVQGRPPATFVLSFHGRELDRFSTGERFAKDYVVPAAFQSQASYSPVVMEVSSTIEVPTDPRQLGFCLEGLTWTAASKP